MREHDAGLWRAWSLLDSLVTVALIGGSLIALAAHSRTAAWILVAALGASVVGHVVIGALAYRRTMRREWPRVEPLPFDDD
jgi:hypothetical protein